MVKWTIEVWTRFSDNEVVVIVERNGEYFDGVEFHPTERLELRHYLLDLVDKIIRSLREESHG